MPYIKNKDRDLIRKTIDGRAYLDIVESCASPGTLNFAITQLLSHFIQVQTINYSSMNAAVGVLEMAKQELYRRVCSGYENQKIVLNGDTFPTNLTEHPINDSPKGVVGTASFGERSET